MSKIMDYLRREGYAVPYMGISVDEQIDYGWIETTTNLSEASIKKNLI